LAVSKTIPSRARFVATSLLTIGGLLLLPGWAVDYSGATWHFDAGTILLVTVGCGWCALWPARIPPREQAPVLARRLLKILLIAIGILVTWIAVRRMLPAVFGARINAYQADMLLVITGGVERFLAGLNPYYIYHLPWEAALPYGPWLWLPYAVPHLLGADPRVFTLVMQCVVPLASVGASCVLVGSGRYLEAASLVLLSTVLLLHPSMVGFHHIGHTQVYWPLLFVFCYVLCLERWTMACLLAGSLVAARTTMVSLIPVFLYHLHVRGELTRRRATLLFLAAFLPFVPFLWMDAAAVRYALIGSYQRTVKEFVWVSTRGAHETLGVTGWLLRRHLERYVELAQVTSMLLVYGGAWRALRRGAAVEPWLALALLVFSMTTLWPVIYVYFDVFVLIVAALASRAMSTAPQPQGPLRVVIVPLAVATVIVASAGWVSPGASYTLDVGSPDAAPLTGAGFGQDSPTVEDGHTFVWIEGDVARVRLPRASRSDTPIHLLIRAPALADGRSQRLTALLNDRIVGVATVSRQWTDLRFVAPRRVWYYGFNLLELRFAGQSEPFAFGPGKDLQRVSAAIDVVRVGGG
jgi:hypothetical protein